MACFGHVLNPLHTAAQQPTSTVKVLILVRRRGKGGRKGEEGKKRTEKEGERKWRRRTDKGGEGPGKWRREMDEESA